METDYFAIPSPDLEDIDDVQFMQFLNSVDADEEELVPVGFEATTPTIETISAAPSVLPLPASTSQSGHPLLATYKQLPVMAGDHTIMTSAPGTAAVAVASNCEYPSLNIVGSQGVEKPAGAASWQGMTKKQLQLEKLRAKNRRSQARYREKCKKEREGLAAKVEACGKQLRECSKRYRTLRYERTALLARIKAAQSRGGSWDCQSDAHGQKHPRLPVPMAGPCPSQPTHARLVPSGTRSSLVPTRIGRQKFVDTLDDIPPTISSFRHFVSISFPDIAPFMPASQLWYRHQENAESAAISTYLSSVCSELGTSTLEVCWFNQLPYMVSPDLHLSHSTSALSPECCISLALAFPALSAEALFLLLEHEMLEAATDPSLPAPAHPELDAMHDSQSFLREDSGFDPLLHTPNARDMARVRVRCGLNKRWPLSKAVHHFLKPMLRRYRALLPRQKWRAVCFKAMSIVQKSISALQTSVQAGPRTSSPEPSTSNSRTVNAEPSSGSSQDPVASRSTGNADDGPAGLATAPHARSDTAAGMGDGELKLCVLQAHCEHIGSIIEYGHRNATEHEKCGMLTQLEEQNNAISTASHETSARHCLDSDSSSAAASYGVGGNSSRGPCGHASSAKPGICSQRDPQWDSCPTGSTVQSPPPSPRAETTGNAAVPEEDMPWEDLDTGILCMMQCVLACYHAVLHEDQATVSEGPSASRTFEQIRHRMLELNVASGIACRMMHETAPVTARRMSMGSSSQQPSSAVQAERLQMKIFSYLQLTAAQKSALAEKWRGWYRSRRALDLQLFHAISSFESTLPGPSIVPQAFLAVVDSIADEGYHGSTHREGNSWPPPSQLHAAAGHPEIPVPGADVGPGMEAVQAGTETLLQPTYAAFVAQARDNSGTKEWHKAPAVQADDVPPPRIPEPNGPGSLEAASDDTSIDGERDCGLGQAITSSFVALLKGQQRQQHSPDPVLGGQAHSCVQRSCGGSQHASTPSEEAQAQWPNIVDRARHHPCGDALLASETGPHKASQGSQWHLGCCEDTCADPPASEADTRECSEMVMESARSLSKLLGVNGEETRLREDALEAIVDVHKTDALMYHEFVSLVSMPSWLLTEVQQCRLRAAHTEIGISMIDMLRLFKAAAHEERWQVLFSGWRL